MNSESQEERQVSRAVKYTAYALFVGLLILVLVLGLELYFRSNPSYGRAGFTFDRQLIYRLTPGLEAQKPYAWGKVGKPPFLLSFNNHGFRGPDIKKNPPVGVKRILVLGDSYTAGLDYPDDEIFTAQWEAMLNASGKEKYQVINASCPAWGTDQQYAYWATQGRKLQPDAVVVMFSPNDLRETWNHRLVRSNSETGETERYKAALNWKEQLGWKLAARSSLFQYYQFEVLEKNYGDFLRVFQFYPVHYGQEDSTDWDRPLFLRQPFAEVDSSYQLIESLLSQIKSDCQEYGGSLHLVKLPIELEIDSTYADSSLYDRSIIEHRLEQVADQIQIPYYNFNEQLREHARPEDIFMDWEFHYDKDGHDWVAEQLFEYLKLRAND